MTRAAGLVLLLFMTSAAVALAQTPAPAAGPPAIVAEGFATVRQAPDQAFVTFATETRAPEPQRAQQLNAAAMKKVRDELRQADIPDEAIQTAGFNLHEEVDYVDGRRVPRGYVVSNTIEVRVDELDELGELIDDVIAAGATSVHNIRFDLRKRQDAEREAVRLAVADARGRAEAAAAGAGLRLEQITRIEEHGRQGPVKPPVPMMRAMAAEADAATTPVAPGEIAIEARVTLTASAGPR